MCVHSMYICDMFRCICACVYALCIMCRGVYMCIVFIELHVYICVHTFVCMFVCLCILCICVYMYVWCAVHEHIYTNICIYFETQ